MLEESTLFQAIDEYALLTLLADSNVCKKKLMMYEQLAVSPNVKKFFHEKAEDMNRVEKKLRKALKIPEGSKWR